MSRLLLAFVLVSCPAVASAQSPSKAKPASVVLVLGDGMGNAAQQVLRLLDGPLAVDGMERAAIVLTASESDAVTDSAAGATALATGVKTQNGAVGVDADGAKVPNIAEIAKRSGRQVGIITTSYLWDASPAAFYAHAESRRELASITSQALAAKPDLLVGGGEAQLLPEGAKGRWGKGGRDDGRNLVDEFKAAGYAVGYDAAIPRLPYLGLLAESTLYESRPPRYAPQVPLPQIAAAALDALGKSPNGFFLIIEEEGIDEMAHANAAEPLIEALRAWNRTVAAVLEYRRKHPETVVLVTADHETGNVDLASTRECRGKPLWSKAGKAFCVGFSTRGHGGMPVTLYASGIDVPGAVVENTAVFRLMKQALGVEDHADEKNH